MKVEYNLKDAKEFVRVGYENCKSNNLHPSFAIYLAYISKGVFEKNDKIGLVKRSEKLMETARKKIRQSYKAKMFEEISAIKSETQRKMMDQYLIQIGDELIMDYMEEKMWQDKRFDELVLFCLGDTNSDLEAGIIAYNLFLGNAA